MSNDESMSSRSSSLDMDDEGVDSELFAALTGGSVRSGGSGSGGGLSVDTRSPAGSFDFTVPAPRRASIEPGEPIAPPLVALDDDMWLHARLAPAMAKSVRSADPSNDMDQDDGFNFDGSSADAANDGSEQANGNRRVAWASPDAHVELSREGGGGLSVVAAQNQVAGAQVRLRSNRAFVASTDASNWLPALGHAPRARVLVDTDFVPPHLNVELFLVGYVRDENDEQVMEYLDRSGHSSHTDCVTSARDHAVYIRLRVTSVVAPGEYELPVRVFTQVPGFCDEEVSWTSAIYVRVVNVQLPPPRDWTFHLDLWQHYSSIARAHDVALWSDRHFELIDRYMAPLAELGQKSVSVVATEVPWAGQQCYLERRYPSALYEHAILSVSNDPARGQPLTVNFQHFDRLLALAQNHGMDAEIEVFGLLAIWRDSDAGFGGPTDHLAKAGAAADSGNSPTSAAMNGGGNGTITSPRLARRRSSSGADTSHEASQPNGEATDGSFAGRSRSSSISPPPPPPPRSPSLSSLMGIGPATAAAGFAIDSWRIRCLNRSTKRVRYLRRLSEIESFIEQFYSHCVTLGIADRVRICADEPYDTRVFEEQIRFLTRVAPGFKVKLALNKLDFFNYAPPQIVDFVPLLPLACADADVTQRIRGDVHERGGKLCWYVCCAPAFPNQFVSSPLVEGEFVGFLTHFLELDGFLRWNYCLWPARPWDDLTWRAPGWKVGDMYFVLPGKDGAPVETLRLESLRYAVQSFELLALAQRALPPAHMAQLKADVAQLVLRTSDFAAFYPSNGRELPQAREELYSLDPRDYERARTLVLETLAASAPSLASPSSISPGTGASPKRL